MNLKLLDTVVRTVFHKYYHPKEVYVTNGVLNRELNRAAGKRIDGTESNISDTVRFSSRFNLTKI